MSAIGIAILIVLLILVLPVWSHSQNFGALPGGAVGLVLIVLLILLLTGRL